MGKYLDLIEKLSRIQQINSEKLYKRQLVRLWLISLAVLILFTFWLYFMYLVFD